MLQGAAASGVVRGLKAMAQSPGHGHSATPQRRTLRRSSTSNSSFGGVSLPSTVDGGRHGVADAGDSGDCPRSVDRGRSKLQAEVDQLRRANGDQGKEIAQLRVKIDAEKQKSREAQRERNLAAKNAREALEKEKHHLTEVASRRAASSTEAEMRAHYDALLKQKDAELRQQVKFREEEVKAARAEVARERDEQVQFVREDTERRTAARCHDDASTERARALAEMWSLRESKVKLEESLDCLRTADQDKAQVIRRMKQEHSEERSELLRRSKQEGQRDVQRVRLVERMVHQKESELAKQIYSANQLEADKDRLQDTVSSYKRGEWLSKRSVSSMSQSVSSMSQSVSSMSQPDDLLRTGASPMPQNSAESSPRIAQRSSATTRSLDDRAATLSAENSSLKQQLERLKASSLDSGNAEEKVKKLRIRNSDLTTLARQLQNKLKMSQTEVSALKAVKEGSQSEVKHHTQQYQRQRTKDQAEHKQQIADKNQEIATLKERLESSTHAPVTPATPTRQPKSQEMDSDARSKIARLTRSSLDFERRLDVFYKESDKFQQAENLQKQVTSLEDELRQLKQQNEEVESQLEKMQLIELEHESLKTRSQSLVQCIEQLEKEKQQQAVQQTAEQAVTVELQRKVASLQRQTEGHDQLAQEITDLQSQLRASQMEVDSSHIECTALQGQLSSLQQELQEQTSSQEDLSQLKSDLAAATVTIGSLKSQLYAALAHGADSDSSRLQRPAPALDAQLKSGQGAAQEVSELKGQVHGLQEECAEKELQCMALMEQVDKLKMVVSHFQTKLDGAELTRSGGTQQSAGSPPTTPKILAASSGSRTATSKLRAAPPPPSSLSTRSAGGGLPVAVAVAGMRHERLRERDHRAGDSSACASEDNVSREYTLEEEMLEAEPQNGHGGDDDVSDDVSGDVSGAVKHGPRADQQSSAVSDSENESESESSRSSDGAASDSADQRSIMSGSDLSDDASDDEDDDVKSISLSQVFAAGGATAGSGDNSDGGHLSDSDDDLADVVRRLSISPSSRATHSRQTSTSSMLHVATETHNAQDQRAAVEADDSHAAEQEDVLEQYAQREESLHFEAAEAKEMGGNATESGARDIEVPAASSSANTNNDNDDADENNDNDDEEMQREAEHKREGEEMQQEAEHNSEGEDVLEDEEEEEEEEEDDLEDEEEDEVSNDESSFASQSLSMGSEDDDDDDDDSEEYTYRAAGRPSSVSTQDVLEELSLVTGKLDNRMAGNAGTQQHKTTTHEAWAHSGSNMAATTAATTATTAAAVTGATALTVVIAKFDYDLQTDPDKPEDELSFAKGDYMYVRGDPDVDGFYEGELLDGTCGMVPSNFVETVVTEDGTNAGQVRNAEDGVGDESDGAGREQSDVDDSIAPPTRLTVQRQSGSCSVVIQWSAPFVMDEAAAATSAPVTGYRVLVDGHIYETTSNTQTSTTVQDLELDKESYTISVRTVCSSGVSPDPATVLIVGKTRTAASGVEAEAVREIQVANDYNGHISVTWQLPDDTQCYSWHQVHVNERAVTSTLPVKCCRAELPDDVFDTAPVAATKNFSVRVATFCQVLQRHLHSQEVLLDAATLQVIAPDRRRRRQSTSDTQTPTGPALSSGGAFQRTSDKRSSVASADGSTFIVSDAEDSQHAPRGQASPRRPGANRIAPTSEAGSVSRDIDDVLEVLPALHPLRNNDDDDADRYASVNRSTRTKRPEQTLSANVILDPLLRSDEQVSHLNHDNSRQGGWGAGNERDASSVSSSSVGSDADVISSAGGTWLAEPALYAALYDYNPALQSPNQDACDDELAFKEGDLIKVLKDVDSSGFYYGELSSRQGLIPCNMVERVVLESAEVREHLLQVLDGDGSDRSRDVLHHRVSPRDVADAFPRPRSLTPIHELDSNTSTLASPIVMTAAITTSPAAMSQRDSATSPIAHGAITSATAAAAGGSHGDRGTTPTISEVNPESTERHRAEQFARALYAYNPCDNSPNPDTEVELSFSAGDILRTFGDIDEDGFYRAELNGCVGLAPSNFVELLPDDIIVEGDDGLLYVRNEGMTSERGIDVEFPDEGNMAADDSSSPAMEQSRHSQYSQGAMATSNLPGDTDGKKKKKKGIVGRSRNFVKKKLLKK